MTIKKSLLLLFLLFLSPTLLMAEQYSEGIEYTKYGKPFPVSTGDKIEVREIFWYGCPHCRDFEPTVSKWAGGLPANVKFAQIPAMFGGAADLHAQVFYALQGMGELERLHQKLFDTIASGRKLRTRDEVDTFLKENGVDMAKFSDAMNSFAVAAKVNRARSLMRRYGVRSVPAVVVDARYRSGTGFSGYQEITEVLDYVVDKVLAQRKAQASR